jgi:hypothetical protein
MILPRLTVYLCAPLTLASAYRAAIDGPARRIQTPKPSGTTWKRLTRKPATQNPFPNGSPRRCGGGMFDLRAVASPAFLQVCSGASSWTGAEDGAPFMANPVWMRKWKRKYHAPNDRQPETRSSRGGVRKGAAVSFADALVEQRIAAAIARGAFDGLPGAGMPLALEDALLEPEETRLANHILRNAGIIPPAVERLREREGLRRQIQNASPGTRSRLLKRLLALDMALEAERGQVMKIPEEYSVKIAERLSGRHDGRRGE